MTVSDGKHTYTVLERKNIFTVDKMRDYPSNSHGNSSSIRVFSYHPGVIHQIDGVLNYTQGDLSNLPAGVGVVKAFSRVRGTDAVYDLQGRRLNAKPQRGLYIQGGKMRMAW